MRNPVTAQVDQMGEAASSRTAIVGKSRAMQSIYKEIGRIAATSVTVLIRGDTGTDIPDMVRYFLRRYGPEAGVASPAISPEAITFLQSQPWPGNVRELENTVRKALLLARNYTISLEHVKEVVAKAREPIATPHQTHAAYITELIDRVERGETQNAFAKMLADLEPELYAQAIRRTRGNLTKAAQWLGVTRLKMREKLKEFRIHPRQLDAGD